MTPGLAVTLIVVALFAWGLYVIVGATDRNTWLNDWLVGENGRMRTALREHGITVDDPAPMPVRTTLRDRWVAWRQRTAVDDDTAEMPAVGVHDLPRRCDGDGAAEEWRARFSFKEAE